MNKQTYITPELEIMNIETLEMMATSSIKVINDATDVGGTDMLGTGRRGAWGNLWSE